MLPPEKLQSKNGGTKAPPYVNKNASQLWALSCSHRIPGISRYARIFACPNLRRGWRPRQPAPIKRASIKKDTLKVSYAPEFRALREYSHACRWKMPRCASRFPTAVRRMRTGSTAPLARGVRVRFVRSTTNNKAQSFWTGLCCWHALTKKMPP